MGPSLSWTRPGVTVWVLIAFPDLRSYKSGNAGLHRATSSHFIRQERYVECIMPCIMLSTMDNHGLGISNWALKIDGHFWPPLCASAPCLHNDKCTAFLFCRVIDEYWASARVH